MNSNVPQLNYERISDDLYYIGDYVLKFNVDLAKKDKENNRVHFHKEYKYNTNKYFGQDYLSTIKRSFDFYLTLERFRNNDSYEKDYIQIRVQNMINLRIAFSDVQDWFLDPKFRGIFAKDKQGRIHVMPNMVNPHTVYLPMDRYINIEPVVFVNFEGKDETGVRFTFGDGDKYVDMGVDKFLGFKYLIDSINMYQSAQIMINYLPQIPCGTNSVTFSDDTPQKEGSLESSVSKRELPCKQNQSFFAQIDKL